MKSIRYILSLSAVISAMHLTGQPIVQTIRGTVTDKVSQSPLPGAIVAVVSAGTGQAAATDEKGAFRLDNIPVGKQSLKITLLGYREITMQDLTVNAGKELVLNIGMEEDPSLLELVEVTAKSDKNSPLNEMSAVSTRAFSVEETQKFAAAVNDPARMATSFAGVVAPGDGNNNISIRGNSPNGLLWRMEGVEIPNPNHFANVGTSGGGISILSAQLLNNSDFSTGAFAAEYGNALSGVFDLRLRKGNNQKREYTFQAGVLGIDAAAEGPFRKGGEGSYLVNYRYSTLSILGKIGVPLGDAITNFQDLSYNVALPTRKFGTFTMFGFGGLSSQRMEPARDSAKWKEDGFYRLKSDFYANTGMMGFTHTMLFGNGYLKSIVGLSATQNGYVEEVLGDDYVTMTKTYEQVFLQDKLTFSSVYTQKLSAISSVRAGIILNSLGFDLRQRQLVDSDFLVDRIRVNGRAGTSQAFAQWNYKITRKLTLNTGLHYFHVFLNNSNSTEPRASLKYDASPRNAFSLGYGLHSQLQPLGVYFAQPETTENSSARPNAGLGLSKAHHFVGGYDRKTDEHSHLKTEIYYQHLFDVPVAEDETSTYSILNSIDGYYTRPLVNDGVGRNMGVELTYERFLYRNLYWLLSASLYDSKYRASDGSWYNTRFNTGYALNITAGKEWSIGNAAKNRTLGINFKSMFVGGFRYTPIDLPASIASGETQLVTSRTFEEKNPDYYRLDIRVSLRRNYARVTSTIALDIQNTTNRKNVGGQYFDAVTGKVKYWYQAPLIPVLSYKVEF